MRLARPFAVAALALLTACATSGKLAAKMDGLVGGTLEDAVKTLGAPESNTELPGGKKAYLWTINTGRTTLGRDDNFVRSQKDRGCKLTVIADGAGKVESWTKTGTSCVLR